MILRFIKWFNEFINPKCDFCGKPESKNNPLFSDDVGLTAHSSCWYRCTRKDLKPKKKKLPRRNK